MTTKDSWPLAKSKYYCQPKNANTCSHTFPWRRGSENPQYKSPACRYLWVHTGSDNFQSEFPRWACSGISFSICTHCPSDMCYKAPCLSPLLAGTLHRTRRNRTRDETTNNNQHYTIRHHSTAPCSVSVLARRRQNRLFLSCPDNFYVRPPWRAALNPERSRVAENFVKLLFTDPHQPLNSDRPALPTVSKKDASNFPSPGWECFK